MKFYVFGIYMIVQLILLLNEFFLREMSKINLGLLCKPPNPQKRNSARVGFLLIKHNELTKKTNDGWYNRSAHNFYNSLISFSRWKFPKRSDRVDVSGICFLCPYPMGQFGFLFVISIHLEDDLICGFVYFHLYQLDIRKCLFRWECHKLSHHSHCR